MLTAQEAGIRVARGAALLDGVTPGWWSRIDPVELEIASCTECVLGQVFGNYSLGITALGMEQEPARSAFVGDHAFGLRGGDTDWPANGHQYDVLSREIARAFCLLRDAWLIEINARMTEGVALARLKQSAVPDEELVLA